jgi:hypothetical protein
LISRLRGGVRKSRFFYASPEEKEPEKALEPPHRSSSGSSPEAVGAQEKDLNPPQGGAIGQSAQHLVMKERDSCDIACPQACHRIAIVSPHPYAEVGKEEKDGSLSQT